MNYHTWQPVSFLIASPCTCLSSTRWLQKLWMLVCSLSSFFPLFNLVIGLNIPVFTFWSFISLGVLLGLWFCIGILRTNIFLFLITTAYSSLNVSSVITITRLMVARFCRNKFPNNNSQCPRIVSTHSCSPDGTINTQVNTLNKCLSSFGSFKVFGLFKKYTNSLKTLLCVVTGCHIEDLRLLVSPFCSTWITDWENFFRSLFKVKILRNFLWYEIRGISPSFKVFAILRIPSSLRITAAFRSVFHDSRSFRETKSPVSSLQWIIHSSTRWRLFSSALSWELRFAP